MVYALDTNVIIELLKNNQSVKAGLDAACVRSCDCKDGGGF